MAKEQRIIGSQGLEFADAHEEWSLTIPADQKSVTFHIKLSSLSAYTMCKTIVEHFEERKRAFDFHDNEVIIP